MSDDESIEIFIGHDDLIRLTMAAHYALQTLNDFIITTAVAEAERVIERARGGQT